MQDISAKHHRRSIRLRGYDYRQAGAYFVTFVCQNRSCLYGHIAETEMQLNAAGQIIESRWTEITNHFPNVSLDEFIVMPNHLHGIILISDDVGAGKPRPVPGDLPSGWGGDLRPPLPQRPTLGQIIAYFKYQSTKQINAVRGTPGAALWQRNYYEHIVRNAAELESIRRYIHHNPAQWALDTENPQRSLT